MNQLTFFWLQLAYNYALCIFHMPDESLFYFSPYTLKRLLRCYNNTTKHKFQLLEPATGLEPVTSPLPRKCSTNWATWAITLSLFNFKVKDRVKNLNWQLILSQNKYLIYLLTAKDHLLSLNQSSLRLSRPSGLASYGGQSSLVTIKPTLNISRWR